MLYSIWDKKTDKVSVFVQVHTAAGFDPDGDPLKICETPFREILRWVDGHFQNHAFA